MGFPLEVAFANCFMYNLEKEVFTDQPALKPSVNYCFVDDCFLVCNSLHNVLQVRYFFQSNSSLNFHLWNHHINFLDVHVERYSSKCTISVFRKPTDTGVVLNALSKCPTRYKESTVKALIHRTYKISTDLTSFTSSIDALKQTFVNNAYSNTASDRY